MQSHPHKLPPTPLKYFHPSRTPLRRVALGLVVLVTLVTGLTAWRAAIAAGRVKALAPVVQTDQPLVGPGVQQVGSNAPKSAASSAKAGSVLFFPRYTSDGSNPSGVNTLLSFINTNPRDGVTLRVFFIRDCQVSSDFLNLAGNQTRTLLASAEDPGKTGYVVAIAVNQQGLPIQFNWVIGSASLRDAQGHEATYNAIGVAKRTGGPVRTPEAGTVADLNFNDVDYDRLPQVVALDNIQSPTPPTDAPPDSGVKTDVAVISPLADLNGNTQALRFTAIAYDQSGRPYPRIVAAACGLSGRVSNVWNNPALDSFITENRPGWGSFAAQLVEGGPAPVLGLSFTDGATPARSARHMQALNRLDAFTMKLPITPAPSVNDVVTANQHEPTGGASGASELKPGSVLIFPRFTSGLYGDSRINLTNTHPTQRARARLFFTGLADSTLMNETIITLFPNQTTTIDPQEFAAHQKGWVLAVAIDNRGLPTNFNFLIGSAHVREQSGQSAGYNALAVAKNTPGAVARNADAQTSDLRFDDTNYDRLPATLALSGLPSQQDNLSLLCYARPPASLLDGVNTRGSLPVTAYDDLLASFGAVAGPVEVRVSTIRGNVLAPPIVNTIRKGHRGWLKMTPSAPVFALLNNTANAPFTTQPGSDSWTGGFHGGATPHILTVTDSFTLKVISANPNNQAPLADFESLNLYQEARGPKGVIVRLDGRISTDPDEGPLTYKWFDGEQVISSAPVSDFWLGLGTHAIKLVVTDDNAITSEPRTALVEVRDTTPPVMSGIPSAISKVVGSSAGFPLNFPLPVAYDMVDGSVRVTASKNPGSVFPPGRHTVTFTARDNAGNETKATLQIHIIKGSGNLPTMGGVPGNKLPTIANLNDLYVIPNKPRRITLQAADDDNDPVTISLQNAPSFARIEAIDPIARKATLLIAAQPNDQPIASDVRVVLNDGKGTFSTLPFSIQLSDIENDETGSGQGPVGGGPDPGGPPDPGGGTTNQPPVARMAQLPATVQATSKFGATVQLDGSQSSDADLDPLTYIWKIGEMTVAEGALANLTLAVGTHQITLTVNDGKGGINTTAPQTVEVLPRPLTVMSVTPPKLALFNYTTVTINGTGFNPHTQVRFDCTAYCPGGSQTTVTIVSIEEDLIVASVRTTQRTPQGNRDLIVTNPNGSTAKLTRSNYVAQ